MKTSVLMCAALFGFSINAFAQEARSVINCRKEGRLQTIYVKIEPTTNDGIFRAKIEEENKLVHDFPGDPLPVLAEYENVSHNQNLDLYHTASSDFILQLGDAGTAHLRAAGFDTDVACAATDSKTFSVLGQSAVASKANTGCDDLDAQNQGVANAQADADGKAAVQCKDAQAARTSDFELSYRVKYRGAVCSVQAEAKYACRD